MSRGGSKAELAAWDYRPLHDALTRRAMSSPCGGVHPNQGPSSARTHAFLLGVTQRTVVRFRSRGVLTLTQVDQLTDAAGLYPEDVWPGWFERGEHAAWLEDVWPVVHEERRRRIEAWFTRIRTTELAAA